MTGNRGSVKELVSIEPNAKPKFSQAFKDRWVQIVTLLSALPLILILGYFGGSALLDDDEWNPLGPYPKQDVLTSEPISLSGGSLEVLGTKCADDDTPVRGVVRWQSISPAGTTVDSNVGTGMRVPSSKEERAKREQAGTKYTRDPVTGRWCETTIYHNEIPDEVVKVSTEWLDGGREVIWIITGEETPSDGNREGIPVVWVSEAFEVGR